MVKIAFMPTGKTPKLVTIKVGTEEKTGKIEARALIKTIHDSIKIEHTNQYETTTITKNPTQNLSYPDK